MFGSALDKWRSFRDTVDETTSIIRWFLGVVFMLAGITTVIWKWVSTLATAQIVSIYICIGALALIGVTFYLDWRHKKRIESIPDLLAKIDQLTFEYIDEFAIPNESEEIMNGVAKIIDFETSRLKDAVKKRDKKQIEEEYQEMMKRYERILNPKKKKEDNLLNLLLISAFLNENNVGLRQVTDTDKYHRLCKRVKTLQRMVPSAEINMKVNDFWRWSEGLYCAVLSTKPDIFIGQKELIPPKVLATNAMLRPVIEGQTSVLISAVRESIEKYKERRKTDKVEKKSKL